MTPGFEDLFDRGNLAKSDWRIITGTACDERDKQLFLTAGDATGGIGREQLFDEIEIIVHARCETLDAETSFGIGLYDKDGDPVLSLLIAAEGVDVIAQTESAFPIPPAWELTDYHAYRLVTRDGKAQLWLEQYFLGEVAIVAGPYCHALLAQNTTVALDMIRATCI